MAIYRHVHTSFWQDGFVLDLTPEEKYFYIYLMTNSKTNQIGCYELPKRVIEIETGYNRETVDKLLDIFIHKKKILYCSETKEILVLNWHKYNWSKSPKVANCIKKEYQCITNDEFKNIIKPLLIEYGYCIDSLSIDLGEKLKTKNQKLKTKKDIKEYAHSSQALTQNDFEIFWSIYPRKVSKKPAGKIYARLISQGIDNKTLIDGATAYAEWCKRNAEEPQFIKHPSTWLNNECWNDELVDKVAPKSGYDKQREIQEREQDQAAEQLKAMLKGGNIRLLGG
jgi:hypothetical protein